MANNCNLDIDTLLLLSAAFCPLLLLLLQALAAMVKLELPHINLLTKMDLAEDRAAVQEFLIPDPQLLMDRWAASRLQLMLFFYKGGVIVLPCHTHQPSELDCELMLF
jgi:hypothetical protein